MKQTEPIGLGSYNLKEIEEFYDISQDGTIYSRKNWRGRGKISLCCHPNSNGYLRVKLSTNTISKTYMVHVLVAVKYLPKRPSINHQIRHLDGNKLNNHKDNLMWGTAKENAEDRELHGTTSKGIKHGKATKESLLSKYIYETLWQISNIDKAITKTMTDKEKLNFIKLLATETLKSVKL